MSSSDINNDNTTTTIGVVSIVSVVLVAAASTSLILHQRSSSRRKNQKSWKEELEASKATKTTASNTTSLSSDVWNERRQKGVLPSAPASSSLHHRRTGIGAEQSTQANNKKPFGSTYYYAHNNPNAKGGYTDGLRMEDFTMNEPRLLSRGGQGGSGVENTNKSVAEPSSNSDQDASIAAAAELANTKTRPRIPKRTLAISKYLWDDPGSANGMATIRIDQLPSGQSSSKNQGMLDWNDAGVTEVTAHVKDEESLTVLVQTESSSDYRLHIPKLYGQVTSATTIIKPKRLLVRLQKKKTGWLGNKANNTKAWPHPQKKLSSSSY